jgi:hypothetical protein
MRRTRLAGTVVAGHSAGLLLILLGAGGCSHPTPCEAVQGSWQLAIHHGDVPAAYQADVNALSGAVAPTQVGVCIKNGAPSDPTFPETCWPADTATLDGGACQLTFGIPPLKCSCGQSDVWTIQGDQLAGSHSYSCNQAPNCQGDGGTTAYDVTGRRR